jgi:hypothetical protein
MDEPLGLYDGRRKVPGRVAVGLIQQIPRGELGAWDLLVLPYAERTVGNVAVRVVTSGHFRRILAFSRTRDVADGNVAWRLNVVAGCVWPPQRERIPVTAVVLYAGGTNPGRWEDALGEKKQLYWENPCRNHKIAAVARRPVSAKKRTVRSIVGDDPELLDQVSGAAKHGVVVLVETPAHARELSPLLPGWPVWTAGLDAPVQPHPGQGVIATELAARECSVEAGVLVRAAGTRWPLPPIDWPFPLGDVTRGVLIDFADTFHPLAARHARARVGSYEEAGMEVMDLTKNTNAKQAARDHGDVTTTPRAG